MAVGLMATGAHPKKLVPGLRHSFFMHMKEVEPVHQKIFGKPQKTVRHYEEILENSAFTIAPTKTEGAGVAYQDLSEGDVKRFNLVVKALGHRVTEEMMEGDLTGMAKRNSKALRAALMRAKEQYHFNIFNNSFTTEHGYLKNGTSEALVATSHTLIGPAGGTASNRPASDVDISFGAFEAMVLHFNTLNDEDGNPVDYEPSILLHHPSVLFLVQELLDSEYKPHTANNEKNALMGRFTPMWTRWTTDEDAWWGIAKDSGMGDGFTTYMRRPLRHQEAEDFDSGDLKIKASERYSAGIGEWRYVYGSSGAS